MENVPPSLKGTQEKNFSFFVSDVVSWNCTSFLDNERNGAKRTSSILRVTGEEVRKLMMLLSH